MIRFKFSIERWRGKKTHLACLMLERPGILLWTIEGWMRLRERGHFVKSNSLENLLAALSGIGSPTVNFVKGECTLDPDGTVSKSGRSGAKEAARPQFGIQHEYQMPSVDAAEVGILQPSLNARL